MTGNGVIGATHEYVKYLTYVICAVTLELLLRRLLCPQSTTTATPTLGLT